MTPVLRADAVFKSYTDTVRRLQVLNGISLAVGLDETVAIVGPSGAGKSTLLHILGGLDAPDQGKVWLGDRDMYSLKENVLAAARNREIGFVFQFYHLLPELNALDNVLLPVFIKNGGRESGSGFREAAVEALKSVGLSDRMDHKPNQLSGGEQQRVAIARALINRPRVLLCDEPTGNLDSATGAAVIDLLMGLNAGTGQAFVIVTHDERVARRCRRVVQMRDGQIIGDKGSASI